tara:strand:+ start:45 stop:878 length:834 start_codon:yes stop_codon:yes gene_type:complete
MSRYGNNLVHWKTLKQLQTSGLYCGDKTYEMLPDNTLIHCQLIDHYGNNIKSDGSLGNELVWCKVSDQRCFLRDNLYAVNIIRDGQLTDICYSTRASLTNWPRPIDSPLGLLTDCERDDSITGPYSNIYNPVDDFVECDCCGQRDIDPNELDDGEVNLAEIGGGYAHESCMSDDLKEEYEYALKEDEPKVEEPKVENPEDLDSSNIKEQFEQTLLSQGITKSQAKLITSGIQNMDDYNLKIAQTMATKGMEEGVKQMFEHPTEKRKLSYAEMRSFYG